MHAASAMRPRELCPWTGRLPTSATLPSSTTGVRVHILSAVSRSILFAAQPFPSRDRHRRHRDRRGRHLGPRRILLCIRRPPGIATPRRRRHREEPSIAAVPAGADGLVLLVLLRPASYVAERAGESRRYRRPGSRAQIRADRRQLSGG